MLCYFVTDIVQIKMWVPALNGIDVAEMDEQGANLSVFFYRTFRRMWINYERSDSIQFGSFLFKKNTNQLYLCYGWNLARFANSMTVTRVSGY
jgi:cytolysin (calcineurin-like family phosphatase)